MSVQSSPNVQQLNELELEAWRGFLRVHSRTIAELDAELLREHDLPLSSYEVLLNLADAPDDALRMGELADLLLLSRSGLTRLIDRLVAQGLVERTACKADRRGSLARLTGAGRAKLDAARPTHLQGVRERFLSRVSERDLERLAAIWERVLSG